MVNEITIAGYAAVLSTFLAVREWYKARLLFDVSLFQTGEPDSDDIIVLYNGSSRNLIISYYELYLRLNKNSDTLRSMEIGNTGDFMLIKIPPSGTFEISITDQYKFKLREGQELFINLNIMGVKKPYKQLIYPRNI
ncbi:hypothetical protein ABE545_23075 [Sphingobacterium faecium]|uniref:hypothetical protein n=1 Tax=Sphingobacterium faecium TaxID=34087 RepID=UPI003209093F